MGGLALQFNGAVWSPAPFKFGPLGAEAWVVWAGLDGTRVFYGEGMAEANLFHNAIFWWLDAKGRLDLRWGGVSAEGLVPLIFANLEWRLGGFYLEGVATLDLLRGVLLQGVWTVDETSRLRAGVFWVDQTWRRGGWSWGLDVGAAVFTVENPTWSQVHRWTEWKFLPPPLPLPVFVEKSSQTDYTLRTSPGWVTVIHPRLTGTLVPGLTWEISRWIPWVSGTTFSITEPGQSAPAGDKAGQPPGTVDAWNLWLAGTQIQLKGQW